MVSEDSGSKLSLPSLQPPVFAPGVLVAAHEAVTASCGVSPRASQALAVTRGLSCTVACGIFVP